MSLIGRQRPVKLQSGEGRELMEGLPTIAEVAAANGGPVRYRLVAFGWLMGCNLAEEKFVSKYADTYCDKVFECYSEPVLEFYGWSSIDECHTETGGYLTTQSEQCANYDEVLAKECIKGIKKQDACPATGDSLALPEACEQVFSGCGEDSAVEDTGL